MPFSRTLHRQMMGIASVFGYNHAAVTSWLKLSCQQQGCQLNIHPYVWTLKKHHRVIRFAPRHYAHIPYIATRFDRYFDSLVAEVKGPDQILDFSRVHSDTYRKPGLTFEISSCPEEVDVLDSYLTSFKPKADDIVFDVGANCGVFTYILSQLAGAVVAFEKDPVCFDILQRNVERHALHNVTLVNDLPNLSDAFARWGIPSYCKISIGGAETALLAPAKPLLSQCETHLAIRTTHEPLGISNQGKIEDLLHVCGYETVSDELSGTTSARPT